MTMTRDVPWALVGRLQSEIDPQFGPHSSTASQAGSWLPPTDIHEESNQWLLHVDLPGVDPKAVEMSSDRGVLSIRGQRVPRLPQAVEGYRCLERTTGRFERRFRLPESADVKNIKATFIHGVLEVAIPKAAPVEPRRIRIDAA